MMESKYLIWAGLIGFGAILGIFFRLKTIGLAGLALFVLAIAGLALGYAIGKEQFGFLCGVAAMAIPFLWGLLMLGAAIVRTIFRRDNP